MIGAPTDRMRPRPEPTRVLPGPSRVPRDRRRALGMLLAVGSAIAVLTVLPAGAGEGAAPEGTGAEDPPAATTRRAPASTDDPLPAATTGILDSLRTRSHRTLSSTVFDLPLAIRDSVTAAFDSTVAADGLSAVVDVRREEARERARRFRFGLDTDVEDAHASYTKVDGATILLPVEAWARNRYTGVTLDARAGYAFSAEEERHDVGIELGTPWAELAIAHHHDLERFGWTDPHAGSVSALFGVDERSFLEREGFRITLGERIGRRGRVSLTYLADEVSARSVPDPFTAGGATSLFERNVPATEGDRRELGLRIGRKRTGATHWWGAIDLRAGGRGLGGDLDYEQIRGSISAHPFLPWSDQLLVTASAQVASAPDSLPVQLLADPAGRNGARGYPQRSILGTHAVHLRVDYQLNKDLFRRARIPFLENRRIQFVPFADVATAWTPDGARTLGDGTWPGSSDWKWSAGIGVRKNVGFGEVLSHVRMDVAWRLDRAGSDPVFYLVLENEPFPDSD